MYNEALQKSDNHSDAYCGLGDIFYAKGDYRQAAAQFRRATERAPSNAYAYCRMGDIEYAQGRVERAKTWYKKATDTNPHNPDLLSSLGDLAMLEERDNEALRLHNEAVRVNETHSYSLVRLAWLYLKRREVDRAESLLQRAMVIDPETIDLALARGAVLLCKGKAKEGYKVWRERLSALLPRSVNEEFEKVILTFCLGDPGAAAQLLSTIIRDRPEPPIGVLKDYLLPVRVCEGAAKPRHGQLVQTFVSAAER